VIVGNLKLPSLTFSTSRCITKDCRLFTLSLQQFRYLESSNRALPVVEPVLRYLICLTGRFRVLLWHLIDKFQSLLIFLHHLSGLLSPRFCFWRNFLLLLTGAWLHLCSIFSVRWHIEKLDATLRLFCLSLQRSSTVNPFAPKGGLEKRAKALSCLFTELVSRNKKQPRYF